MIADKKTTRGTANRAGRFFGLALTVPVLALASGCDSLLDVSNPGQITVEALNDAKLAETLTLSAQGDFECFFTNYIDVAGVWSGELYSTHAVRVSDILMSRNSGFVGEPAGEGCRGSAMSLAGLPLHVARVQAEEAVRRIQGFPAGSVANANFLIGKAQVYGGFAYQIAGETFCEVVFDGGSKQTRAEAWQIARQRFTSAIENLTGVTGANAAEAAMLVHAARIGRARANLNLGDRAAVLADASVIPVNFVFNSTHSAADARRYNQQFERIRTARWRSVAVEYRNLTVGGMPDPRVQVQFTGPALRGSDPHWAALKYTSLAQPIPIASWREAQLMIAEVEGGQTAVAAINRLRATHSLPQFSSTNQAEIAAQVQEERRRELFLQGTRIGDMLRWGTPFKTGLDPRGAVYGTFTCVPLHEREIVNNPNL